MALGRFAVLSAAQYPLRKRCGIVIRIIVMIAKFLLATVIAFILMVVDNAFFMRNSLLIAALYAVMMADAAGDLVTLPVVIMKRKTGKNHDFLQIAICFICAAVYLAYGTINMQVVTANRFTVTSEKLSSEYKVVFASDMHVGSAPTCNCRGIRTRGNSFRLCYTR